MAEKSGKEGSSKMSVEEAGRKGGEARAEKYSKEELSEQAKRAAQTVEKEHPGFHEEIGKKGGEARGQQRKEETGSSSAAGGKEEEEGNE